MTSVNIAVIFKRLRDDPFILSLTLTLKSADQGIEPYDQIDQKIDEQDAIKRMIRQMSQELTSQELYAFIRINGIATGEKATRESVRIEINAKFGLHIKSETTISNIVSEAQKKLQKAFTPNDIVAIMQYGSLPAMA